MTIYFFGGEMAGLNPSDAAAYETTASGSDQYDPTYARAAIMTGFGDTAYAYTPDLGLPDDIYVHFDHLRANTAFSNVPALVLTDGSTELFRIVTTGLGVSSAEMQMQCMTGSGWTDLGSAVPFHPELLQTIDVHIEGNSATGTATLFLSGTQQETAVGDLSLVTGLENARFYGMNPQGQFVSQVIIADESTVGWYLLTRYPDGAGNDTAWTGTHADVDEAVYSDADFISSASADQVETYTQTGASVTDRQVRAVGVYARAKRGATGPQNLQLALRSGGTTYFSGSKALEEGYASYGNIWTTNPAGGSWDYTAIAALEPGVKSIA